MASGHDSAADSSADVAIVGLSFGSEAASPCDVAVRRRIEWIGGFGEEPFVAGVVFAEREEVRSDVPVLFGVGEPLFSYEKLVHEGEADGGFFAREVEGVKFAAEFA